jgi:small subunit ribosomal protein S9
MPKKNTVTDTEVMEEKKDSNNKFVLAVGRRREAVARVRLYHSLKGTLMWGDKEIKKGEIFINGKPAQEYLSGDVAKAGYEEPLRLTNTLGSFTVTVRVDGGGLTGQLEAMIHGISRALSLHDVEKFRPILKKRGFLVRDSRTRQRRKVGTGGKSRRKKQSPKR